MNMRATLNGTLICIALTSTCVLAQDDSLEAFVDEIAEELVGESLAGLSVGVARGDEILLKKSYGLANIEWQVPMSMDAVHEIGSMTKQFTAVAILQLVGQERLELDADISEYLPDFDTQGRAIPLRRLLDHTSGIKGYTEIPEFRDLSGRNAEVSELLDLIASYPFDFEPGEALIYNNSGYFLLGLIIEEVTGQTYEDYLEEHVFPLAGMDNSSYCSNIEITPYKAAGYTNYTGKFTLARYHSHQWPFSAGSLCSTVSDLLAWNDALHNGGVLSPTLYELLITPQPLGDGSEVRYAMGVNNYVHPTGRIIEHGGAIAGFQSHGRYYPEHDTTIVVLQNASAPPGPARITTQIGEHLFGNPHMPVAADYEGDLARFVGSFRGAARGTEMTIHISEEGDNLRAAIEVLGVTRPANPIVYLEDDVFFGGANFFRFDSPGDGKVSELRLDGPSSYYILERVDD